MLNRGLLWARDRGYASDDDLEVVEEHGHFQEARSEYVSDRAKERGASQLGTIGAGRLLSRTAAKRTLDYDQLRRELSAQGIVVRAGSARGLLEEAPEAYKDVDQVIRVIEASALSRPVANLVPTAVIKG